MCIYLEVSSKLTGYLHIFEHGFQILCKSSTTFLIKSQQLGIFSIDMAYLVSVWK